jgi:hypothetical protein
MSLHIAKQQNSDSLEPGNVTISTLIFVVFISHLWGRAHPSRADKYGRLSVAAPQRPLHSIRHCTAAAVFRMVSMNPSWRTPMKAQESNVYFTRVLRRAAARRLSEQNPKCGDSDMLFYFAE